MTVDFRELEALALQNLDLPLFKVLASRQEQYQDVTPAEILDLLEEAAQSYAIVAPTLPSCLQNSAKKEIAFFLELYLDSLTRNTQNSQPPENITLVRSSQAMQKSNAAYLESDCQPTLLGKSFPSLKPVQRFRFKRKVSEVEGMRGTV